MAIRKKSTDGLVTTGNRIDKDTMKMVKRETVKRNGMKKIASGISVTPPSFFNPLYSPSALQLPRDRKQINVWCRNFYNTEAIPAAVIDLYASLPITDFSVECLNPHVRKFLQDMTDRLKLRQVLQGIALEFFTLGDVFILAELDEDHKTWKRLVLLNPDQVEVRRNVLANEPVISMIPDDDLKRIVYDQQPPELYRDLVTFMPDVIRAVKSNKNIPIDPAHITHMKHMPSPYGVYGTPLLKRIFKTLMYKEMLRRAQFVIAERYVTPLKIFKLGTLDEPPPQEEIDAMQAQLDAVLLDPTMVLVTTARLQADWQGISGKTLNLSGEYDFVEREMFSGLGVSRAYLDGTGTTGSASIGGNAFLQKLENFRQDIKDWVEEKIFKPICELNDFYDDDPDTGEKYLIKAEFKWDALRLQDEASKQQALANLRQINLLSAKTLLESNHINPESEAVNLADERDTIFDANRIMARQIAMTQGLQLKLQNQYAVAQQKEMMDLQGGMAGAAAPAPGMPGVADSTGAGVNVAGGPGPGAQMDVSNGGGAAGFAPMGGGSALPPVGASYLLNEVLKTINAMLEEDD